MTKGLVVPIRPRNRSGGTSTEALLQSTLGHVRELLERVSTTHHIRPLMHSEVLSTTGAFVVVGWPLLYPQEPSPPELPRLAALAEMTAMVELSLLCCEESEVSGDYLMGLMTEVMHATVDTVRLARWGRRGNRSLPVLPALPPSPVEVALSMYRFGAAAPLGPAEILSGFIRLARGWVRDAATTTGRTHDCERPLDHALASMTATLESRCRGLTHDTSIESAPHRPSKDAGAALALERAHGDLDANLQKVIAAFQRDVQNGAWDGIIECLRRSSVPRIDIEEPPASPFTTSERPRS